MELFPHVLCVMQEFGTAIVHQYYWPCVLGLVVHPTVHVCCKCMSTQQYVTCTYTFFSLQSSEWVVQFVVPPAHTYSLCRLITERQISQTLPSDACMFACVGQCTERCQRDYYLAVSHAWGFPLSLDRVVHLYYLIINNFLSDATTTSTNISVRGRVRIQKMKKKWKYSLYFTYRTPCPTDEAHQHTGVVALLGHTRHTITNGVLGVSVCVTFFRFLIFFERK